MAKQMAGDMDGRPQVAGMEEAKYDDGGAGVRAPIQ